MGTFLQRTTKQNDGNKPQLKSRIKHQNNRQHKTPTLNHNSSSYKPLFTIQQNYKKQNHCPIVNKQLRESNKKKDKKCITTGEETKQHRPN